MDFVETGSELLYDATFSDAERLIILYTPSSE